MISVKILLHFDCKGEGLRFATDKLDSKITTHATLLLIKTAAAEI